MKLAIRSLILISLQIWIIFPSFSQTIDYNTIILPDDIKNVSIEEKLVQLAWNNSPHNKILENELAISKKSIAVNQANWLDIFRVSGNLNEYTINPDRFADQRGNRYYPRYNFGATLNLGIFISAPAKVKIARIEYLNQKETINDEKLKLRADVLRNYYTYKQAKELYKLQSQITEDSYSSYQVVEQQFKNGEVTLEKYSEAFQSYNNQAANKIIKETNYEIAKVNLEELIGVKVDDVIND